MGLDQIHAAAKKLYDGASRLARNASQAIFIPFGKHTHADQTLVTPSDWFRTIRHSHLTYSWSHGGSLLLNNRPCRVETAAELDAEILDIFALDLVGRGNEICGTLYVGYSDESVKQASLVLSLQARGVKIAWRKSSICGGTSTRRTPIKTLVIPPD
jgi:hypothetical protein